MYLHSQKLFLSSIYICERNTTKSKNWKYIVKSYTFVADKIILHIRKQVIFIKRKVQVKCISFHEFLEQFLEILLFLLGLYKP